MRWGLLLLLTAAVAYGMGLNPFSGGRDWPEDYDQARRNSASTGRPLLIQFTLPGCTYCVRMEREVLRRPDVADSMSPFELVRVNAARQEELSIRFAIEAVPAFVVLDSADRLIGKVAGYHPADTFKDFLTRAAAAADSAAP